MVWLSDAMLVLLALGQNLFLVFCWRARSRNGSVLRGMFIRELGWTLFIDFFTVVYWDRRWDVVPWVNLHEWLGFEWYWLPRLIVVVTMGRLFWVLVHARARP